MGFLPAHSLIYDTSSLSNTEPSGLFREYRSDIFITSVAAFQRSASLLTSTSAISLVSWLGMFGSSRKVPCVYTRRGVLLLQLTCFQMSSRKRRRSDDSAVDKLSVVQRDFDLFKREQERERKRNLPPQDGEIMLDMEVPPSPCSSSCSFCRSHSGHPFVYMCKTHFRIHVCGSACQEKIMSRENWTCPWTNEVIGVSLIAEDKASSSNCGRHISSDAYNSKVRLFFG